MEVYRPQTNPRQGRRNMFMAEHKHHAEARAIDLIGLRQTHGQLIAEARQSTCTVPRDCSFLRMSPRERGFNLDWRDVHLHDPKPEIHRSQSRVRLGAVAPWRFPKTVLPGSVCPVFH